jgi:hypothetical protein
MGSGLRYFGGAVAFGFAAVWIMASLAGALVCLAAAAVGYGAVLVLERLKAGRANRTGDVRIAAGPPAMSRTPEATLPLWADALNSDLGHIFEPGATTSPLSRESEYGWPLEDDAAVAGWSLH